MKRETAILVSTSPDLVSVGGVLVKKGAPYQTPVVVLTKAGNWAMVRRVDSPRAMPFVVDARNLRGQKVERKKAEKKSLADQIVEDAKKRGKTLDEQLEIVRWWRDVNAKGNFKMQFACATAIDKLKGYYA